MPAEWYPIGAVVKLTGIGLDRLRAWERRYGAVEPEHGARGRLYSEAHIQRLVLLRELVDRGHAIGRIAGLADEQLQRLLATDAAGSVRAGHDHPAAGALLQAVEKLDHREMDRLLSRSAALLPPRDLVHMVALPLIRTVGAGWHEGRFTIAQEHMVSAALRSLLGGLLRLHSASRPGVTLLLATPSNEPHEFGILAAALLAAGVGLGVVYLGPNLPAPEIADASRRCGSRVIVLGIAGDHPSRAIHAEIAQLARQKPPSAELWVGGSAGSLERLAADGVVRLRDFEEYERHLRRLGALI